MNTNLSNLDWSLVQAFLAVADTGSLSGAAKQLGSSQPTLGRQVKAMEAQLGADLFHRHQRGLSLTETGAALVAPARTMREAMQQIALTAAGQQQSLQGTVRITASVVISAYQMPRIIADIREAEPEIEIELVPSDDTSNLLYREADIAVRMYRPTQLDLITQHLGEIPIAAYAARSYLQKRGMPTQATLMDHDFVGYDADTTIIDEMRKTGVPVDRHFFGVRCDDTLIYWNLVRQGCGIGFSQSGIGDDDPLVQELDFGFPLPSLQVWLTAHEVMRQTPRIRRVWDLLAKGLKPLVT